MRDGRVKLRIPRGKKACAGWDWVYDSAHMKTAKIMLLIGFVAMVSGTFARAQASGNVLDLGVRYHHQQPRFVALPYSDGDLGYGVGYEIQDQNGALQLICGYTPDFKDRKDLDYALSPELNLLAKDGVWQGGLGILKTYVQNEAGNDRWTDLYYQFLLGLNFRWGNGFPCRRMPTTSSSPGIRSTGSSSRISNTPPISGSSSKADGGTPQSRGTPGNRVVPETFP